GNKGYFIAMPSSRLSTGNFKDIAHPTNTHTRNMLNERVLEEFYAKTSANNVDLTDSNQVESKSEENSNDHVENNQNYDSNNEESYNCD
ncbi:MAG: septation protein SpoVG family protein, partial [Candidatus Phytoplasma australasiaticum]|nr:septation protein SpoVG family protein [Candidatus Phytoplasma australasiaticum]